jgi:hypothetical protein
MKKKKTGKVKPDARKRGTVAKRSRRSKAAARKRAASNVRRVSKASPPNPKRTRSDGQQTAAGVRRNRGGSVRNRKRRDVQSVDKQVSVRRVLHQGGNADRAERMAVPVNGALICEHCNQPRSAHSLKFGRCPSWTGKAQIFSPAKDQPSRGESREEFERDRMGETGDRLAAPLEPRHERDELDDGDQGMAIGKPEPAQALDDDPAGESDNLDDQIDTLNKQIAAEDADDRKIFDQD